MTLDSPEISKNDPVKQSPFGIISFWSAVAVFVCIAGQSIIDVMAYTANNDLVSHPPSRVLPLIVFCLFIIGVVTGIIGVVQKKHKRSLAVMGLVIFGCYIMMVAVVYFRML
jgi:hypothetical protein